MLQYVGSRFGFGLGSLAAAALLIAAGSAKAYTVDLDSFNSTGPFTDTRLNGSATADPFSLDLNGSVKLNTTDDPTNASPNREKASAVFYNGTLGPVLGTLGDLARGSYTADWHLELRDANTTASYVYDIAYFILNIEGTAPGTFASLYWESAYQSPVPTFTQGQWYDNINLGSGRFHVFDPTLGGFGTGDPRPLSQWASGTQLNPNWPVFNDSTKVYSVSVMIGSAAGNYTAYVDDITLTFTAIPEPASLYLLALGGATLLRRRRA